MNVIQDVLVSSVVPMVVLVAPTQFAFAVTSLLHRTTKILKLVFDRIVLNWGNVFLIVMKTKLAKLVASKNLKIIIKTVPVR